MMISLARYAPHFQIMRTTLILQEASISECVCAQFPLVVVVAEAKAPPKVITVISGSRFGQRATQFRLINETKS
jgi:hypothetical protein